MDITAWVQQLSKGGFRDALNRPKTTMALWVAFVLIRWVLIASAFAVALFTWMLVSVIAGLFKSL